MAVFTAHTIAAAANAKAGTPPPPNQPGAKPGFLNAFVTKAKAAAKADAEKQAGAGTLLGGPTPPSASLAAANAATAAMQAAKKQRARAAGAMDLHLGTPGTSTPAPRLQGKTLLGY